MTARSKSITVHTIPKFNSWLNNLLAFSLRVMCSLFGLNAARRIWRGESSKGVKLIWFSHPIGEIPIMVHPHWHDGLASRSVQWA